MLKNVHLKNLALIKEADIDFDSGLDVMTGETGSGKSIIISSINIALGGKANKGIIRSGCNMGLVELQFTTNDEKIHSFLKEQGIQDDDENIIITRKLSVDSSTARINGQSATLSQIKALSSLLIDIHGQHDHQSLLNSANHIVILDQFGSGKIRSIKDEFILNYENYKTLKTRFAQFSLDPESVKREVELCQYQLDEINNANLTQDEDVQLEKEYKRMSVIEKQSSFLNAAVYALNNEDNGAKANVSKALLDVTSALAISDHDSHLKELKDSFSDLDSVIRDLSYDLSQYSKENSFDAVKFKEIKDRLNIINTLKSKYGRSINDILTFADNLAVKLKQYDNYSKDKKELLNKIQEAKTTLNRLANDLSKARYETAEVLEKMITSNLKELNFLTVNFTINISKAEKITAIGFDKVEFLISTNPGEAPKPLVKIASGGELSRIMLAIKSSLAEKDSVPTLIFDEIDTGISGMTAQMVAQKLYALSRNHQIICITHLPQIASMADSHYSIHKEVADGSTISGVEKLDHEWDIKEIAKMVGGMTLSQAAVENARELKNSANNFKTSLK